MWEDTWLGLGWVEDSGSPNERGVQPKPNLHRLVLGNLRACYHVEGRASLSVCIDLPFLDISYNDGKQYVASGSPLLSGTEQF